MALPLQEGAGWLRKLTVAVGIGLALAGGAHFRPEPLSPTANAAGLDDRTLDDPRLHRFLLASLPADKVVPDSAWNLDTLTLAALYYHPDLAVAGARLAVSRAGVITARERPNPTLNLSAVFGSAAVSGAAFPPGVIPVVVGPVVNLLVETFGKREDRTAQAQHLVDAARADLATAAWGVRGRVRTALLNLWAAQRRLKLAQEHLVEVEGRRWGPETAVEGAADRLVPILMTSLVTALGLLPLAVGMGNPGREVEGPMAVVILGGLLTSMALNLLVLPTLALRFGRFEPVRDEFREVRRHLAPGDD